MTAAAQWATWRNSHLREREDLEKASLAAAKILGSGQITPELKAAAIREFGLVMRRTGADWTKDFDADNPFWESQLFPYLEGRWKFKYEIATPKAA